MRWMEHSNSMMEQLHYKSLYGYCIVLPVSSLIGLWLLSIMPGGGLMFSSNRDCSAMALILWLFWSFKKLSAGIDKLSVSMLSFKPFSVILNNGSLKIKVKLIWVYKSTILISKDTSFNTIRTTWVDEKEHAITRKCACKAMYVPLQVMDLYVKYHNNTMCSLQDMDLTHQLNQSVMDGQGKHYMSHPHSWLDIKSIENHK